MKLSELIKSVEVKIPDTDLVIEVKAEMSWFEQLDYRKIEDDTEKSKYLFSRMITKWNLVDEKDVPLPITTEIIGKLPSSVALPIIKALTELATKKDEKKKK